MSLTLGDAAMRILGAPSDKALQFPDYEEGDDPFEVSFIKDRFCTAEFFFLIFMSLRPVPLMYIMYQLT